MTPSTTPTGTPSTTTEATAPNRVCSLFGIRLPLLMGAISPKPELGAVVSQAGGLGCIEGISSPAKLRAQIRGFRERTDAPFSVNFPLAFGDRELVEGRVQVAIEEKVPVVMTSAGSAKLYTKAFQEAGIRVAHVIAGVAHARKAAEAFPKHVEQLVLAADDTSTMSATGPTRPRVSKPELAERVLGDSRKRAQMGQVAALIDDVPTIAEVVEELFGGGAVHARELAAALGGLVDTQLD